ncbi:MAG: phenylalanine--tRNA ligase subunit beta [Clostridia bacterium]|nr:phenylalanine--tRNA ligase subunit beta [Clostridia bacterium]
MKLSTNFVKDYVDIDVDLKTLAEDMTKAGNEYDSAEKLINATNLVIGEVLECEEHPDSDHLHVCKVNVGNEVLQIVCGAPNVRVGLKVVVALEGAKLPGDFTIKRSTIRGVESCGMMCSLAELGIESKFLTDKDKNGIHELPENAIPGEDPIKFMKLDDEVIDFDLTANRGDLLSILGMAYEIGAIYDKKVRDIDLSHKENSEDINNEFKVEVNTDNCSIFLAKKVKNVTIKESPDFIKNRLIASGIRPINNVVDISNYVMLETGQPLHYYDADTLNGKIEVRMAKNGEKLTTLDEIERTLKEDDIVISDGNKAIGLAGVMGGLETEITENTKNIIIEAAIFDAIKVRKTSKEILRSEASSRFEKGLDPNRTYMAIERSCNLLEKYADAEVVSGLAKFDETNKEDTKIDITFEKINNVLGLEVPKDAVVDTFRRLGFTSEVEGETVHVSVPKRRLDISIKEDLIEEVGRIYGVDNIQGKLPELPMKAGSYNKTIRQIRNKMIALGLNETLSYILVNDKEALKYAVSPEGAEGIGLLDPMTEERNTLRYSIIPSLVKIYEYNKARSQKDICIFEIGKGFYKKGEEYVENTKLSVLMTGEYYAGITDNKQVDFYTIKGVTEEILNYIGYEGRYSFVIKNELPKEYHPYQTAEISVNNDIVGIVGRLHPEQFKDAVYVMEISLDKLLDKKVGKMKYKEISKYPSVKKDIAVVVSKDIEAQSIAMAIKKAAGKLLLSSNVFDVYEGIGIEPGKKSLAYSLEFGAQDRTLTDEEIATTIDKIVTALEKEFKAELRK